MKVMTLDIIVADEVKYMIESENLKEGDKLPGERELSERFCVQRLTLRLGLQMLEEEGYIYSKPRKGYYVAKPRIQKNVKRIVSSSSQIQSSFKSSQIKLIKLCEIEADKYLNKETNLPLGTRLYEIKRLRIVDGEPVSVDYSFIPKNVTPGIDKYDFEQYSLYNILELAYGIQLSSSIQTIEVFKAEPNYRDLLGLSENDNIVLQSGKVLDKDGNLIEFSESYMKQERFAYVYD